MKRLLLLILPFLFSACKESGPKKRQIGVAFETL